MNNISARNMVDSDLSDVLRIETSSQVMPWNRQSFEESLSKQHYCRVLEEDVKDNHLLAFHVVCPVVDELHILTLAVKPELQGSGIGHALMHDIIDFSKLKKLEKIFLEVRASNLIAQNLYQKWQFKQIAIRENYYRSHSKQREDAFVYVRLE